MRKVWFCVKGNPQSKANSRRSVLFNKAGGGKRVAFIKSDRALSYVKAFKSQCPDLSKTEEGLITGPVMVTIDITYESNRSDLDESLILDCMQDLIYVNDRQVKKKLITHCGTDKKNPVAYILVEEMEGERNGKKKKDKGRVR